MNRIIRSFRMTTELAAMNKRLYATEESSSSSPAASSKPKRVQNQFRFEKSPLLKHYENDKELSTKLYEKLPVVLLLGWTGSRDDNLLKYQSIYTSLGYHVIRFAPADKLTFLDRHLHPEYAHRLLNLMKKELKLVNNPIITHQFSNAPLFVLYNQILREISGPEPSKEYNFFKLNHRTDILDSAIGWPVPGYKLLGGMADLLSLHYDNPVKRYSAAFAIVILYEAYYYANFGNDYFSKAYETINYDSRCLPTLSMYSKGDKLISAKSIAKMIRIRRKAYPNIYIKEVVFEDADHVLLYPKYPEEYVKHIHDHLNYCKLDLKSVLKEANITIDPTIEAKFAQTFQIKSKL